MGSKWGETIGIKAESRRKWRVTDRLSYSSLVKSSFQRWGKEHTLFARARACVCVCVCVCISPFLGLSFVPYKFMRSHALHPTSAFKLYISCARASLKHTLLAVVSFLLFVARKIPDVFDTRDTWFFLIIIEPKQKTLTDQFVDILDFRFCWLTLWVTRVKMNLIHGGARMQYFCIYLTLA